MARKKAVAHKGLKGWRQQLGKWRTLDGESYCPECYPLFLNSLAPDVRRFAAEDAVLSSSIAHLLTAVDGWIIVCCRCAKVLTFEHTAGDKKMLAQ